MDSHRHRRPTVGLIAASVVGLKVFHLTAELIWWARRSHLGPFRHRDESSPSLTPTETEAP